MGCDCEYHRNGAFETDVKDYSKFTKAELIQHLEAANVSIDVTVRDMNGRLDAIFAKAEAQAKEVRDLEAKLAFTKANFESTDRECARVATALTAEKAMCARYAQQLADERNRSEKYAAKTALDAELVQAMSRYINNMNGLK